MNISKHEQRVLHALAQGRAAQGSGDAQHRWNGCGGGCIRHRRDDQGHLVEAHCFTRDGHILTDGTLALFRKLKRRGLIASRGGAPYRITRLGLEAVRAQADQR